MMKVLCLLLSLYVCVQSVPVNEFNGKNWVVLVAGSNTWGNYRHQADIYHTYQIVRANGIPDENIIVFHYDDIANNPSNTKFPGKVFNNPNHTDVYHPAVPKDYVGDEVTPENFIKVLLGDAELENAGKKVLKSGANDHVFIFFDDHGAPDLVAFPKTYLYADKLNTALKQMHDQKKFAKLVFYIEACEAGSMFENHLPTNLNIYATTASNAKESSWGCYSDSTVGAALGDLYSVMWMEGAEQSTAKTTLQENYEYTKVKTTQSHVMQYGDLSIAKLPLSQFIGTPKGPRVVRNTIVSETFDNHDSALVMAQKSGDYKTLADLSNGRQFFDTQFNAYLNSIQVNGDLVNTRMDLKNRECYHKFVDTFNDQCLNIAENSYALGKLYTFVNICEQLDEASAAIALQQLVNHCQQNFANGHPTAIL